MALTQNGAIALTKLLIPDWTKNRAEVGRIDRWYRDKLDDADKPAVPRSKLTKEYRQLRDRSQTPWLGLIVTAVAQNLYVEGYRAADEDGEAAAWQVWQANSLDGHQIAVHRDALAHGLAYTVIIPGTDPLTGDQMPYIEGVSSLDMVAYYDNPARDDWPNHALRGETIKRNPDKLMRWKLYDEDAIHTLESTSDGDRLRWITMEEHNVGVCPIVRFANRLDLKGRVNGEVESFIPLASRIDQDIFDRLVVQRFGSWRVRYATGMAEPETDKEKVAAQLLLGMGDLLVNESTDARFGTLDPTDLKGYIEAHEADVHELAAVSQTPAHQLLGKLINLSAEALAAAEASLTRKVEERRHMFGESWEQTLRLSSHIIGDDAGARAYDAQVRWRDTESRSLAQAADALGKLATMLGVPPQGLWEKIPGATKTDIDRWTQLAKQDDAIARLLDSIGADLNPDV
jgi:hypothetical protein